MSTNLIPWFEKLKRTVFGDNIFQLTFSSKTSENFNKLLLVIINSAGKWERCENGKLAKIVTFTEFIFIILQFQLPELFLSKLMSNIKPENEN